MRRPVRFRIRTIMIAIAMLGLLMGLLRLIAQSEFGVAILESAIILSILAAVPILFLSLIFLLVHGGICLSASTFCLFRSWICGRMPRGNQKAATQGAKTWTKRESARRRRRESGPRWNINGSSIHSADRPNVRATSNESDSERQSC
jgi:hypothetical protein